MSTSTTDRIIAAGRSDLEVTRELEIEAAFTESQRPELHERKRTAQTIALELFYAKEAAEGEATEQVRQLQSEFQDKVASYQIMVAELSMQATQLAALASAYQSDSDARKRKAESLKANLAYAFDLAQVKAQRTFIGLARFQGNPDVLHFDVPEAEWCERNKDVPYVQGNGISLDLVKTELSVKRSLIADLIKRGHTVPDVRMVPGGKHFRIK